MTDYTELIHDLRYCADRNRPDCSLCEYESNRNTCKDRIKLDAADAIETLLSTNAWNEEAVKHLRGELDRLKGENE